MKKISALCLAAAITVGGSGMAFAEEIQAPSIMYNAQLMEIENIKNENGRVMLPFRAVFEMMGAEVDYDNGKVTAKRGDKTIEFMVGGDNLKVTDGSGTREIKAEIGFDYERDRVMVPVRFVSEAIGAGVGWEDSIKTVCILDTYPMIQAMKNECPDLYEYCKSTEMLEKNVKSESKFNVSVDVNSMGKKVNAGLGGSLSEKAYENKAMAGLKMDFSQSGLSEIAGTEVKSARGINLDVIKDDKTVYIKTNLISKLSDILPQSNELKQIKKFAGDDDWYRIDYDFVEKQLSKPFAELIFNSGSYTGDGVFEMMDSMSKFDGDITIDQMISTTSYFETLKSIYKKAEFKSLGEKSYTFNLDVTSEDMYNAVSRDLFETEEEYNEFVKELKDVMAYDLSCNLEVKDGVVTKCNAKFGMNMKMEDDESFAVSFDVSSTSEKITKPEKIETPKDSVSLAAIYNVLV